MKSKKKYIIAAVITIIVSLLITVPPILQGKVQEQNNKEEKEQIASQILAALRCNGFPNSELNNRTNSIYINKDKKEYIDIRVKSHAHLSVLQYIELSDLQKDTDVASILDAVMPIFDKKFEQGDGEIIADRLIESRWHDKYEDEVHAGSTSYHHIKYDEFLDDTESYADWIYISL